MLSQVEAEFYVKVHNAEREFEQKFSKIFDEVHS